MALLKARETVMSHFRPILAAENITEQQWRVLRALADADRPLSVSQIVERTFLLGPSLSRILAGLERRGLLDRDTASDDARRALISANPDGRALLAKIGPLSEARYRWIEDRLGAGQLDRLYDLLALVADAGVDAGVDAEAGA
jgi:homoprotocatechuate degradation regulator HpaR